MIRYIRTPSELDEAALTAIYGDCPDMIRFLRRDFFTQPGDLLAILEKESTPVCALRLEAYLDGLLLEALETAPAHRRQGYASALIREVLASLPQGTAVYAHVEKRNTPSLRTHLSCGFRVWKDSAAMVDGTVTTRYATLKF